jgi:hypothetical protein
VFTRSRLAKRIVRLSPNQKKYISRFSTSLVCQLKLFSPFLRCYTTTAKYPFQAFRHLWLVRSHILQGMTDDVSADVATQGTTRQVPNPASKSAARTGKTVRTEKARESSRIQTAHCRNRKTSDTDLPYVLPPGPM